MSEYYENNLYDVRNLSLQSQSEFLGEIKEEAIHDQLNRRQVPTATGEGSWHIPGTWNLLHRIEGLGGMS